MHQHFNDSFSGLNFGVRSHELHVSLWDKINPAANPVVHKRTLQKSDSEPSKEVDVTVKDQVKEAVKDGKINSKEKTVFKKPEAAEIVKSVQETFRDAIKKAGGDTPPVGQYQTKKQREHEDRVDKLKEDKKAASLEKLDEQAKAFDASGNKAAADSVRAERNERASEEAKVAEVIENRETLIGSLEAEKTTLQEQNSDKRQEEINAQAQALVEQFNASGGQYYQGNDLFGDDWDASKVSFEQLAERFRNKPELLDDFVGSQGRNDKDLRGKTEAEAYEKIANYDSAEERNNVRNRYTAAQQLVPLIEEYNKLYSAGEEGSERITQIDQEIATLKASNEHDSEALSQETLDKIAADNQETGGIIEESSAEQPADVDPNLEPTDKNGDGVIDQGDITPDTGETSTDAGESNAGPSEVEVPIDYNTPERRQEVLVAAQQANLLPAENTTFNEAGEAVYTVQPGDSYWRISDMSDGQPQNQFDVSHFQANIQSNSERFGRDPQSGLIHPNEQLILANRTIQELVALLQLPTVENVDVPANF